MPQSTRAISSYLNLYKLRANTVTGSGQKLRLMFLKIVLYFEVTHTHSMRTKQRLMLSGSIQMRSAIEVNF